MSVLLMGVAKDFVRGLFTPQQVVDVAFYGGEFSTAEDVVLTGFKCPAILIAGLGWTRPRGTERMTGKGTRVCHMAAFVITNQANRADRMLAAQALAEQLDIGLVTWRPEAAGPSLEVAAPEDDIRCENVYNRKVDQKGLALWLVTWRQCIKPALPLPEMFDLLGIDIVSTNHIPFQADQAESDEPVPVTHDIRFQPPV